MITKETRVTISIDRNFVTVRNDKGMSWKVEIASDLDLDTSSTAFIGQVASSFLAGTVADCVKHTRRTSLSFTLLLEAD